MSEPAMLEVGHEIYDHGKDQLVKVQSCRATKDGGWTAVGFTVTGGIHREFSSDQYGPDKRFREVATETTLDL